MTAKVSGDPFVQVGHSIEADPIYGDDHLLATWLRMYLAADSAHPALPARPRVRQKVIAALVDAGRVELAPNDRYSIPGLAEKREYFARAGKDGGQASVAASVRGPDGRFYPRPAPQPAANPGLDTAWSNDPSNTETEAEAEPFGERIPPAPPSTAVDGSQVGPEPRPFDDAIELQNKPGDTLRQAPERPRGRKEKKP